MIKVNHFYYDDVYEDIFLVVKILPISSQVAVISEHGSIYSFEASRLSENIDEILKEKGEVYDWRKDPPVLVWQYLEAADPGVFSPEFKLRIRANMDNPLYMVALLKQLHGFEDKKEIERRMSEVEIFLNEVDSPLERYSSDILNYF